MRRFPAPKIWGIRWWLRDAANDDRIIRREVANSPHARLDARASRRRSIILARYRCLEVHCFATIPSLGMEMSLFIPTTRRRTEKLASSKNAAHSVDKVVGSARLRDGTFGRELGNLTFDFW
jgi:hypothetical protein